MGKTYVLLFYGIKYFYRTDSKKIESRVWESKPNRTVKILNRSSPSNWHIHSIILCDCTNQIMSFDQLNTLNQMTKLLVWLI